MKKIPVVLSFIFFSLVPALSALTISVYHTSDVHGWYSPRPAKWDKENSTRSVGGFPALASLIEADKNPRILLDSGDTFQGTPEGTLTRGLASAALMNELGYSAAVVGNHEYDYGEDVIRQLVLRSSFPWLGANVEVKKSGAAPDYLKPYVIVERGGKKIAVIGIAGRHTATSTLPLHVNHLRFKDETDEAVRWTEEVKKLKPDAIIILAHIGFGESFSTPKVDISTWTFKAGYGTLAIARAAKGVNVVIGGHAHIGFLKGHHDERSGTLIAESGSGLTDVNKIELNFDDKTGKFTGATSELVPLWTDTTGESEKVAKLIAALGETVSREMDKVLGESETDLVYDPSGLNSPIGNWMTDLMRRQAGTDIAFQNTTGIRSDLKKGVVTMRDVYQIMPFENTIAKFKMTGAQLTDLIKDNMRGGRAGMQVSGLTVKFRLSQEAKASDIILEHDGKPVAAGDEFTVATNNYLTSGGTGGRVFTTIKNINDTMIPIRDFMIKDIRETSPIKMPAGGRYVKLD